MDFIGGAQRHSIVHTDQLILLFNTLLSKHVINGDIDLTGKNNRYVPNADSSDLSESEEEDVIPDVLNP